MSIAENSLRVVRMIHLALLFAAAAYLVVPLIAAPSELRAPAPVFAVAFGFVASSALGSAAFIRSRLMKPAGDKLQINPEDKIAVAQWQRGVMLSLVFCATVPIFGCVMRLMGAPWNISGIFYTVGIFFLLAWRPRLDLPLA